MADLDSTGFVRVGRVFRGTFAPKLAVAGNNLFLSNRFSLYYFNPDDLSLTEDESVLLTGGLPFSFLRRFGGAGNHLYGMSSQGLYQINPNIATSTVSNRRITFNRVDANRYGAGRGDYLFDIDGSNLYRVSTSTGGRTFLGTYPSFADNVTPAVVIGEIDNEVYTLCVGRAVYIWRHTRTDLSGGGDRFGRIDIPLTSGTVSSPGVDGIPIETSNVGMALRSDGLYAVTISASEAYLVKWSFVQPLTVTHGFDGGLTGTISGPVENRTALPKANITHGFSGGLKGSLAGTTVHEQPHLLDHDFKGNLKGSLTESRVEGGQLPPEISASFKGGLKGDLTATRVSVRHRVTLVGNTRLVKNVSGVEGIAYSSSGEHLLTHTTRPVGRAGSEFVYSISNTSISQVGTTQGLKIIFKQLAFGGTNRLLANSPLYQITGRGLARFGTRWSPGNLRSEIDAIASDFAGGTYYLIIGNTLRRYEANAPVTLGTIYTGPSTIVAATEYLGLILMADQDGRIWIVDIANPSLPFASLGQFTQGTIKDLSEVDDELRILTDDGIYAWDLSYNIAHDFTGGLTGTFKPTVGLNDPAHELEPDFKGGLTGSLTDSQVTTVDPFEVSHNFRGGLVGSLQRTSIIAFTFQHIEHMFDGGLTGRLVGDVRVAFPPVFPPAARIPELDNITIDVGENTFTQFDLPETFAFRLTPAIASASPSQTRDLEEDDPIKHGFDSQTQGRDGVSFRDIVVYQGIPISVDEDRVRQLALPTGARWNPNTDTLTNLGHWSREFPSYNPQTQKVACTIGLAGSDGTIGQWIIPRICEDEADLNAVFRRSTTKPARLPDGTRRVPIDTYDTEGEIPPSAGRVWVAVGHKAPFGEIWTWGEWQPIQATFTSRELDVWLLVTPQGTSGAQVPAIPRADRYTFETDTLTGLSAGWTRARPQEGEISMGQVLYASTGTVFDNGQGVDAGIVFSRPVRANNVLDIDIIYRRAAAGANLQRPANTMANVIAAGWAARAGQASGSPGDVLWECVRRLTTVGENVVWVHDDPYIAQGRDGFPGTPGIGWSRDYTVRVQATSDPLDPQINTQQEYLFGSNPTTFDDLIDERRIAISVLEDTDITPPLSFETRVLREYLKAGSIEGGGVIPGDIITLYSDPTLWIDFAITSVAFNDRALLRASYGVRHIESRRPEGYNAIPSRWNIRINRVPLPIVYIPLTAYKVSATKPTDYPGAHDFNPRTRQWVGLPFNRGWLPEFPATHSNTVWIRETVLQTRERTNRAIQDDDWSEVKMFVS